MALRCDSCQKVIAPDIAYQHWLWLLATIENLYTEENITEATYIRMYDSLMTFGTYAKESVAKND